MEHDLDELKNYCINAVTIARQTINKLGDAGISKAQIPGKDELVTKADLGVLEAWRAFFKDTNIPIKVLTEESRDNPFDFSENPRYLGVGDEIDGTYNFNRARGILPNCAIFTIFDSTEPKFRDALVTAVLEHNSSNLWYAIRGQGCFYNGKPVHTSRIKTLGKDTSIFIDRGPCPLPEHSLRYFNLEQRCWPRNVSCAGVHLAGVASGSYSGWDGFLCMIQKPEELASGYLLIKEAGGAITDTSRNPIGEQKFDWNRKYEIIAAATPRLAELIRMKLLSQEQASSLYQKMTS